MLHYSGKKEMVKSNTGKLRPSLQLRNFENEAQVQVCVLHTACKNMAQPVQNSGVVCWCQIINCFFFNGFSAPIKIVRDLRVKGGHGAKGAAAHGRRG